MNPLSFTFAFWLRAGLPASLFAGAELGARWNDPDDDCLGCASGASDGRAYWQRVATFTAAGTPAQHGALAAAALTIGVPQ